MNSRRTFFQAAMSLLLGSFLATQAHALERLEPLAGCYIGMLLDDEDNLPRVSARLGLTPAAYTKFYGFPFSAGTRQEVSAFLDEVRGNCGIAVLTLEPFGGLSSVTAASCADLADLCASQEAQGIGGIMIRLAHEMNGNWYAWGQQPSLYRQTFQLVANVVHARTARTAMLWAPNNGIGYPYGTGAFSPAPGSADFLELDTNHDGVLSEADDMFGPFYPGDAAVDWVGLTIYHWGVNYPWGENEPPFPGEFAGTMNATGPGAPADYSRWFYPRFCADGVHNKPLAIAETSAFYNTEQPGGNEVAMKRAWFRQIYNISGASADGPDIATTFPKLKCINWFDHFKSESEVQGQFVDWRASANPLVRGAFVAALRTLRDGQPYFLTAQEFNCLHVTDCIVPISLPAVLPLNGNVAVHLKVKAQQACDMEIDLLDQNFAFQGGTRVALAAGTSTISTTFALNQPLVDGATYHWSIFLTPTGGTWLNALAWYRGPEPVARSIVPMVGIDAAPPSVAVGGSFNVRVRYTAAADSVVQLSLLDTLGAVRGSGSVSVARGDGLLDLTLTQQGNNATGAYLLRPVLKTPLAPPQTSAAQGADLSVHVSGTSVANAVTLIVEPAVVPIGEVLRFAVGYATTDDRDLRLEVLDANLAVIAGAVQSVNTGSGTLDLTCVQPLATAGAYAARVHLVPTGGSSAQAVVSSSTQTVHLVSHEYADWTQARWGVIFNGDPIAPLLDPDGDGAPNQDEYVALTDPRGSTSRFQANLVKSGAQLTLSWLTVTGRNYQVFSRAAWSADAWVPASSVQAGTGGTLQIQSDSGLAGPQRFYLVQVTVPVP